MKQAIVGLVHCVFYFISFINLFILLEQVDEIREEVDAIVNPIIKEGESIKKEKQEEDKSKHITEKENQEKEEAKPSTDQSETNGESNDQK